jgi:hypothetical protein
VGRANIKFGGGVTATILNPYVMGVILVAGILICVLPRNKSIIPFIAAALLVPTDQVMLIGPAHFPMLRILVGFGFVRIIKEKFSTRVSLLSGGTNKIDSAVILLTIFIAVNGVLLFEESGALVNQLGNLFTVFGVYFLLRHLIRDERDIISVIRVLAWVAMFVAVIMAYEITTGHNPYGVLGGARASLYSILVQRDDRFRAQGPFAHSILAGTFGAVLLPLFIGLWWGGKQHRKLAFFGVLAATVITLACNSSTPILGYAAGVFALCLWPLRRQLRLMRWGLVSILICLHIVMKGPVWSLIEKIDITGGSSSYHRYMLIDQCIRHFWDWWLVGIKDTSIWGWDMWDTANQYVSTCENSGIVPFILLIAILVYGFKFLGRARQKAETRKDALFVWALGSALFANVVAFFGISYFDQTQVAWYALLAMVCAVPAVRPRREVQRAETSSVAAVISQLEGSYASQQAITLPEPPESIIRIASVRSI